MRLIGVFNDGGGTFRTMDMAAFTAEATAIFARHGHSLECRVVAGDDIAAALRAANADPSVDAVLVGGGDGTISAAAASAFESGVPLAVLPAGTMNMFARSLHVPLELTAALEALATGTIRNVDIATANGKPFVHQFGAGIHARLVRIRESMVYRSRWGKMLASVRATATAVARPPRFTIEIATPRGTEVRKASGIAVTNNPIGGEAHSACGQPRPGRPGRLRRQVAVAVETGGTVLLGHPGPLALEPARAAAGSA